MNIGLQLYSVRDSMENDFEGTVKRVAQLGYTSVEFAGFYGRSPEQINELLNSTGLTLSGIHASFDDLLNNYDETVAFSKAIGNKNYIVPCYDLSSQEKLDFFVEKANLLRERLAKDGIVLGYHNHDGEFYPAKDGSVAFEQLIYRTELRLEVDTYWAFVGMKNPLALMERLKERISFVHIKDGLSDGMGKPLGEGVAPVAEVVALSNKFGIPMVVESETCNPSGIEESHICIEYLKSL